jgi:putative transcriptional regulator
MGEVRKRAQASPGGVSRRRTALGREIEAALQESLAHARGEMALVERVIPTDLDVVSIRRRLGLSRARFARRFGLDPRAVQDWEQGRRRPDRAARVLLTIIEREPDAVDRVLAMLDAAAA